MNIVLHSVHGDPEPTQPRTTWGDNLVRPSGPFHRARSEARSRAGVGLDQGKAVRRPRSPIVFPHPLCPHRTGFLHFEKKNPPSPVRTPPHSCTPTPAVLRFCRSRFPAGQPPPSSPRAGSRSLGDAGCPPALASRPLALQRPGLQILGLGPWAAWKSEPWESFLGQTQSPWHHRPHPGGPCRNTTGQAAERDAEGVGGGTCLFLPPAVTPLSGTMQVLLGPGRQERVLPRRLGPSCGPSWGVGGNFPSPQLSPPRSSHVCRPENSFLKETHPSRGLAGLFIDRRPKDMFWKDVLSHAEVKALAGQLRWLERLLDTLRLRVGSPVRVHTMHA